MTGAPASIPWKAEEPEDLSVDGSTEKELGKLILTLLIHTKLLDDRVRETQKVGAWYGFLVRFDLRLDPIEVRASHISR